MRLASVIACIILYTSCLSAKDVPIQDIRNPFLFGKVIIQKKELPTSPTPVKKRVVHTPAKPQLTLNGIFKGKKESYVLINQELMVKGDSVGEWTIISITPTSVTLMDGSKRKVLTLK